MNLQRLLFVSIAIFATINLSAQVAINDDGSLAGESAMLDVQSTSKGFLPPRMSEEQRNAITAPEAGLVVWCNNCGANGELQVFNGTDWTNMIGGSAATVPFPCGESLLDTRDNKSYATVQIGTQCWMAQNLNVGTMIHSTTGGTNGDGEQTDNSMIEKYCYDNSESNCESYGGLYQWAEMVDYINGAASSASWDPVPADNVQGICPEGWHLPGDDEWDVLVSTVEELNGYSGVEGKSLKSTSGWTDGGNGTDTYGFTGLPGGMRNFDGTFDGIENTGAFRSTLEKEADMSWFRVLSYDSDIVYPWAVYKHFGFSVRCIAD